MREHCPSFFFPSISLSFLFLKKEKRHGLSRQARDRQEENNPRKGGRFWDCRAPYGIPLRATHFAWGNQVKGADRLSSEQVLELGAISAEASFAVNGGFVYVNAEVRFETSFSSLTFLDEIERWFAKTSSGQT
eukprot:COSAG06_NODE_1307_length_9916_cov_99.462361_9_plen_133_part_00